MKTPQPDNPMDEEREIHNHTLKEALEAKRLAAARQPDSPAEAPAARPESKGKRTILIAALIAAVLAAALAAMRILAPDQFYKLFRIDPLKASGVVLTIDEFEVSRDEYLSYVAPAKQRLEETYGAEAVASQEDFLTLVKQYAEESLFGRYTLLKWAGEYGITVEDVTDEELQKKREDVIAGYGGREAYKAALAAAGSTEAVAERKLRQELVIEKLTYCLAVGDDPFLTVTDEEAWDYYREHELYAVKHVLLLAGDLNTAEEKTESAQKILSAAQAGQPFDELVKLYSEDTEKESYLGGYICQGGEQEPAFERAALSVDPGQIYPGVISTSYGYHVIQRIEPALELMHQQLDGIILDGKIQEKTTALQNGMLVYYAPGYNNITFAGIDKAVSKGA